MPIAATDVPIDFLSEFRKGGHKIEPGLCPKKFPSNLGAASLAGGSDGFVNTRTRQIQSITPGHDGIVRLQSREVILGETFLSRRPDHPATKRPGVTGASWELTELAAET
ncbi:MAG: hypothetical protein SynsKO_32570 [Synoicihabitans sp.]